MPPAGPQFVRYFAPVLRALVALGGSGRPAEVQQQIVQTLELDQHTQDELSAGGTSRFRNRVAWARFYLVKAGLIDAPERGVWRLTAEGALAAKAMTHDEALRLFYDIHAQWQARPAEPSAIVDGSRTARESMAEEDEDVEAPSDAGVTGGYRDALLARIRDLTPDGFERFSQRLLRESGFEEVKVTGRSGDRGIDGIGILQVNALMSTRVLFQCKRYAGSVGPGEIRDFRGAMAGRTDYGIVLTTGTFTSEARREAVREGVPPIELIDADAIVGLCERFHLGLRPVQTYTLEGGFFTQFD